MVVDVLSVAEQAVKVRVQSGSLQVVVVDAGYSSTLHSTLQSEAVCCSRQVVSSGLPPGPGSVQPTPTQLVPEEQKGPMQPHMPMQPKL